MVIPSMSRSSSRSRRLAARLATAAALAAGAYAGLAAVQWWRYGDPAEPRDATEEDSLLGTFMPEYEVVERHHIRVDAPAAITLAAAADHDLLDSALVRAIFKTRELIMRAKPDATARPQGLLAQVQSLGWGVLAEVPGREIIVGAVTRPWEPQVTFRAVAPADFAAFEEPGYVKIAWTLRADRLADGDSVFHTETRVIATDAGARARFRRYWAAFSPGIGLIRRLSLRPLKREAERRARDAARADG
jgi:hypothetical protein